MKSEELEKKWNEVKGQVKQKWSKLTDKDITFISGKKNQLLSKIRERHQVGEKEAENQLTAFLADCKCESNAKQGNIGAKSRSAV